MKDIIPERGSVVSVTEEKGAIVVVDVNFARSEFKGVPLNKYNKGYLSEDEKKFTFSSITELLKQ